MPNYYQRFNKSKPKSKDWGLWISFAGLIVSIIANIIIHRDSNKTWKALNLAKIELTQKSMAKFKKLSQADIDTASKLGYNFRYYLDADGEHYYVNFHLESHRQNSEEYRPSAILDTAKILKSLNVPLQNNEITFFQVFHPILEFKNISPTNGTVDSLIIGIKTFPDVIDSKNVWPIIFNLDAPLVLAPSQSIMPPMELRVANHNATLLDSLLFKVYIRYTDIDGNVTSRMFFLNYTFSFDMWYSPYLDHTIVGKQRFHSGNRWNFY